MHPNCRFNKSDIHQKLIRRRCRIFSRGEANTAVRVVPHVVEPLEERHAVDEVHIRDTDVAEVVHDQVDAVRVAANVRVELEWGARARPSARTYIWRLCRLTERGQVCAFAVNSYVVSPISKNRLSRLS